MSQTDHPSSNHFQYPKFVRVQIELDIEKDYREYRLTCPTNIVSLSFCLKTKKNVFTYSILSQTTKFRVHLGCV